MIITCEECSTQYQLDDSRVPEHGARVRCSRCKHAFFAKRPAAAGDAVEQAVERALAEDAAESTQELGPAAAVASQAPEPLGGFDDGLDESDWGFNDDAPGPDPGDGSEGAPEDAGLAAAREAVDDLLGGGSGSLSGGEVDALLDGATDVDHDIDSLLDAKRPQPALDAADLAGPVLEEPGGSLLEEPAGPVLEDLAGPVLEESGGPLPGDATGPGIGDGVAPADDELGSPDGWDFFACDPEDAEPDPAPTQRLAVGRIGEAGAQPIVDTVRPPIDVDADASKPPAWLRRVAQGVGWGITALLVTAVLYHSVLRSGAASPTERTAWAAAGLEATSVEGRWIENAVAGSIYVISGALRGARSGVAVPGAWLAVRLLDQSGGVLVDEAAALGPALAPARLREDDPQELRAIQAREALSLAGSAIGSRDGEAFHAILGRIPAEVRRFDLVAIAVDAPEIPAGEVEPDLGAAR